MFSVGDRFVYSPLGGQVDILKGESGLNMYSLLLGSHVGIFSLGELRRLAYYLLLGNQTSIFSVG